MKNINFINFTSKTTIVLYGCMILLILLGLIEQSSDVEIMYAMRSIFVFHIITHIIIAFYNPISRYERIIIFGALLIMLLGSLLLSLHRFNIDDTYRDIKEHFDLFEYIFYFVIGMLIYAAFSIVFIYHIAPFFILTLHILKTSNLLAKITLLSIQIGLCVLFGYLLYYHTKTMHGGWFLCFPIICLYPTVLLTIGVIKVINYNKK